MQKSYIAIGTHSLFAEHKALLQCYTIQDQKVVQTVCCLSKWLSTPMSLDWHRPQYLSLSHHHSLLVAPSTDTGVDWTAWREKELANRVEWTRERVGQRVNNGYRYLSCSNWSHYCQQWFTLLFIMKDYYASVGGATRHTVVRSFVCVSVILSAPRTPRRLKTKR